MMLILMFHLNIVFLISQSIENSITFLQFIHGGNTEDRIPVFEKKYVFVTSVVGNKGEVLQLANFYKVRHKTATSQKAKIYISKSKIYPLISYFSKGI